MTQHNASMNAGRDRRAFVLQLGALALTGAGAAPAQSAWPDRTVRFVVTTAAGGAGDLWGRAYADAFSRVSGRSAVVDNKTGAGGLIGTASVLQSPADGYTLLVGFSSVVSNEVLRTKLPYKLGELVPIAGLMTAPQVVMVDVRVPVRDLAELRAYARSQPKGLFYAAAGLGSTSHLVGEQLRAALDIPLTFVHYRSGSECMASVMSGQTQLLSEVSSATAAAHLQAGQLRALGLTGKRSLALFPGVETAAQQGFGDIQMESWIGIFGRAATPEPVLERIVRLNQEAKASPSMRAFFQQHNAAALPDSADSFVSFVAAERERMAAIAHHRGLRIE